MGREQALGLSGNLSRLAIADLYRPHSPQDHRRCADARGHAPVWTGTLGPRILLRAQWHADRTVLGDSAGTLSAHWRDRFGAPVLSSARRGREGPGAIERAG